MQRRVLSGFIAERNEAGWMVAGVLADSATMASWLNRISYKSHREFLDDYQPSGEADYRVSFEGDNMQPVQIKAFAGENDLIALNSSLNPESWFSLNRKDILFKDLFPGLESLLSPEE